MPEGVTESGNEDNDEDFPRKKNKKEDPHRALNIDLNDKPLQKPVEQPPPPPPPVPIVSDEKPKKSKKQETTTTKPKKKRERTDYKELVSPVDEEEKKSAAPPPTEQKSKKKKTKEKIPATINTNKSAPLLFDFMSDDIHPTTQSNQQNNEQDTFKLAAQSDNLTVVSLVM